MRTARTPGHILSAVPFANMRSAPAARCSRILRVRCRVTGAVSSAHQIAKVEPIIVRYFSPALSALVQRDYIVETLSRGVCQQMRFFQTAPPKSG